MKTAFITGAAEGQGFALAKRLAAEGWEVFAGVLPGVDISELERDSQITPVEQDVSDADSVKRSVVPVRDALAGRGLNLLVNNAGIANLGQGVVEGLDLTETRRLFDINTFGMVNVLQSFLPLVRAAAPDAKVINYSSGAVIANPPANATYNMSKHAILGLTLTLRHEISALGVEATAILPGGVHTFMTRDAHTTTHEMWNKVSEEMNEIYGPVLKSATTQTLPDMLEKHGNTVEYMTDEMMKIIGRAKLKPMYMVGKDVKPLGVMRRLFSDATLEKLVRKTYKIPSKI